MITAMAIPGNTASTFLTHFFGSGLADERYVVERFKAQADGDIRRSPGQEPATAKKGRRKAKRVTATLNEVKEMRPASTEIIVSTGLRNQGRPAALGGSRNLAVPRPPAEGLSGVLRGRPAGRASSAGFRFRWENDHGRRGPRGQARDPDRVDSAGGLQPPASPERGVAGLGRRAADARPATPLAGSDATVIGGRYARLLHRSVCRQR